MIARSSRFLALLAGCALFCSASAFAQIGKRFPSERRVVKDPVTGVELTFLTSTPGRGDSKMYPTHLQWTADGEWVVFRSNRAGREAMAVHEKTGEMVQVTEGGYMGTLCLSAKAMELYFLRRPPAPATAGAAPQSAPGRAATEGAASAAGAAGSAQGGRGGRGGGTGPTQIVRVDLAKLFADSAAGTLKPADAYQKICGTIPVEYGNGADMALDATDQFAYFRVNAAMSAQHLPPDVKPAASYGPRGMGAGPNGLASMNLKTGEVKFIVAVPFQVGHVQTNPWVPGEIVFCWETGGKAPQRTWTVKSDGTGLRPLYPEAEHEWVTHEAVISRDEVAFGLMAHRRTDPAQPAFDGPGQSQDPSWGPSGMANHPTGLAILNVRTREVRIVGQVPVGDPGRSVWHMHGSPDGRWAVADDFLYRLWLYDRRDGQMVLLADFGQKLGAQDHLHPTFNPDGRRIQVQTAMLSEDGTSMNICVLHVPDAWLKKTYPPALK